MTKIKNNKIWKINLNNINLGSNIQRTIIQVCWLSAKQGRKLIIEILVKQ